MVIISTFLNFVHFSESIEYAMCPQLTVLKKPNQKEVTCAQNGYQVDCETPSITWYPGTELEIRCPPYYRAHFEVTSSKGGNVISKSSTGTLCDDSGRWSRNNVSCKPGQFPTLRNFKIDF